MFEFDGRFPTMVACSGSDVQVSRYIFVLRYREQTGFFPSCLLILSSQLLELCGEVERSFLVEQPFDGQIAFRDYASVRREPSFANKGLV